jgi:hypothetical protein
MAKNVVCFETPVAGIALEGHAFVICLNFVSTKFKILIEKTGVINKMLTKKRVGAYFI